MRIVLDKLTTQPVLHSHFDLGNNLVNVVGGRVGIGIATPAATLEVHRYTAGDMLALYNDIGSKIVYAERNSGYFYAKGFGTEGGVYGSSGIFYADSATNQPILLRPQGVEKVRIDKDGNVGIGGITPEALFHVRKDQNAATSAKIENQTAGTLATAQLNFEAVGLTGNIGLANASFTTAGNKVADQMFIQSASTASAGLLIESLAGNITLASFGELILGSPTGVAQMQTNGLTIGLAASPPDPDNNAVHIWKGTAGVVEAYNSAPLIIEGDNPQLSLLSPAANWSGIIFGNPTSNEFAWILNRGDIAGSPLQFKINQAVRLQYSANAFAFQEATTISTTAGILTLSPATYTRTNKPIYVDEAASDAFIIQDGSAGNEFVWDSRDSYAATAYIVRSQFVLDSIQLTGANPSSYSWGNLVRLEQLTFNATNAGQTISAPTTLYIAGAPIMGTNTPVATEGPYAILVDAGVTRLDGDLDLDTGTGLIRHNVIAAITASTTQTQGQGALTAEVNEVSVVANANDTVTLPSAVAGYRVVIINNGANTLRIFPASGDNLGAGVDTATTLASGDNVTYQAYSVTDWEVI